MSTDRMTEAPGGGPAFDKRRDHIVECASQLFNRDGYAQTSMIAIAEASGLRKPTLYHYFRSKSDILVQIHTDHTKLLADELRKSPRGEVSPEQRLRAVVKSIVHVTITRPHATRVFHDHARELPPRDAKRIAVQRRAYREEVMEIIQDGIDQGVFRPELDKYYATMTVFGVTNWLYQWYERDAGSAPDTIAEVFWDFIDRGIRA